MTRQFSGPTLLQLFKICCHPLFSLSLSPADEKEILLAEYLVFAIYFVLFAKKGCRNESRFANLANLSIKTSKYHQKILRNLFQLQKRL
jgi:hypothetical protein